MRTILLLCLLTAPALAETPDAARLAWLEGRWSGVKDGVESEEIWSSPAGGALVGMHKDVKDGRMVGWEFFRVARDKDSLVYFASPGGNTPVPFAAAEVGDRRVVFANEGHDFPQRILYWLDDKGALHARVEGRIKGKVEGEEWVWTRAR